VLGIVFFKVQAAMFPEPKIVIGPLHDSRREALEQQWFARVGQPPSARQKAKMIADELERDLLFQHALALELHLRDNIVFDQLIRNMHFLNMAEGKNNSELFQQALDMRLHQGDELVKRRLIEKVQQRLLADHPPAELTQAELRDEFSTRRAQFRLPASVSIAHVFFKPEREAELESLVATIQQQNLDAQTARHLSSPFMSGYEFKGQTPDQLARHFGAQFVSELAKAGPVAGQWLGEPIRSVYGWHYVWVTAIEPGRDAQFEEVEPLVRRDLEDNARAQALQNAIAILRKDYEVRM